MHSEITLNANSKELSEFLDGLFAELIKAPHEIRKLALDFLNIQTELVSFEFGIASGAVVPILLKPSQRFLDFSFAVRAGDFKFFVI